jgi:glycosyltransferase involved in cell wall biosynthesis
MTFDIFTITPLHGILLGATLLLAAIQLLFYLVVYMRPYRRKPADPSDLSHAELPPVSVIVYAKNESANLANHLPILLRQQYPKYEVIVINDGSTDESDDVLAILEKEHPNLYHTFIPEESKYLSRRKLSLTLGIKAAKNDILFFIEANCRPMSPHWLDSMTRNYTDNLAILLGYCAYPAGKGFLHKLIGYDNLVAGTQYISSALAGHPFSGSGRNLSYRKSYFFESKGFIPSLNLHAGDDDLFVNRAATRANTRVEYSPDSITEMAPVEYFGIWKEMKVSRAATRHHYRGMHAIFYRIESLATLLFLIAVTAAVTLGAVHGNLPLIAGATAMYVAVYVVKAIVWRRLAVMLRQRPFTPWLPLLEISRILFDGYVMIYRAFRGKHDYTYTMGN